VNFKDLTKKTKQVSLQFPKKFQWGKKERFLDLVEEVGELANAILVAEKKKPQKVLHPGNSIADALCDILFDLLLLADYYKINLDKECFQALEKLEERIKKGQFKE
jgi:NTP pyrophosphatase (non-canonical NTP hydrolase)